MHCQWISHKFGMRTPHSVKEALQIDRENGNCHWEKAINKEMAKAKVAWKMHEDHTPEEAREGKATLLIAFSQ